MSRTRPTTRPRRVVRVVSTALVALLVALSAACEPEDPGVPSGRGIWISQDELRRLPTRGPAWDNLVGVARGPWGTPSLSDNDAKHDTNTLAGALVAARTGDRALADRTRAAIAAMVRTVPRARVLELSRNLTSYVVAADVVGLPEADRARLRTRLRQLLTLPLQGHSGGTDLVSTALRSPNNWGTMARAAVTAVALYLGDGVLLDRVARAHRAWLGDRVANELRWSDTGWHASNPRAGVNRAGTAVAGRAASGILPEEQRRTGEPSSAAAPKGSYPWEALQGAVVTGVMLHRAGAVPIGAGDRALARAASWLTTTNRNPATGDDTWQPWVLNRVAGTNLPTAPARSPGKNMGWSDWTHGPVG